MELAEARDEALRSHHDVGLVEPAAVRLDEPGHDHDPVPARGLDQAGGGGTARHGLGQPSQAGAVQAAEEGIARDRAFVEADDPGALPGGLARERVDAGEVVGLVPVPMLELGRAHEDVAH